METVYPSITLDEIVNNYLDMCQMPQSKYRRIYAIAIRGWRLFYRDSTGISRTVTLPVLTNQTSVLPADAMNKIRIGILNDKGEIASLIYDPLLSLTETESSKRLSQPTNNLVLTGQDLLFSFQDSGNLGFVGYGEYELYGIGSQPQIGFYNIDWQNRVIVYAFNNTQQITEVIFEYLAVPSNDGQYDIHPFFQEALIAYINWQDSVGNTKKGDRDRNKRDFDIAYNNARRAMQPFDPSDTYNQYRQSVRLSPKA